MEPADDNSGGHSTSRHQPNPQILSHDQIFRAQVGETLVLPCQVAALGKDSFFQKCLILKILLNHKFFNFSNRHLRAAFSCFLKNYNIS